MFLLRNKKIIFELSLTPLSGALGKNLLQEEIGAGPGLVCCFVILGSAGGFLLLQHFNGFI